MELLKKVDWFLRPTDFELTTADRSYKPTIAATQIYLAAIEQLMVRNNAQFAEESLISGSLNGPLSELVSLKVDFFYQIKGFPQKRTPFHSLLQVTNQDQSIANQLSVALFPGQSLPWIDGTAKKHNSQYLVDYNPVGRYLVLIRHLLKEMDDNNLLTPGESRLAPLFSAKS